MYLLLNLIMKTEKVGLKIYSSHYKYTCKKKKTCVTLPTAVILILERIKLYFSCFMLTSNS